MKSRGARPSARARPRRQGGVRATPSRAIASASRPPARVASATTRGRIQFVDAARGFAVVTMIAYHFCFDLTYYGWAGWQMLDDPGWIAWRTTIVASFLFVAGVSLALRDPDTPWLDRRFIRRSAQVAAAAALVTAGSALLFPDRFIYFGVLHFVAVGVWLCRRAPRRPLLAATLAVVALALGVGIATPAFDPRWLNWIGFAATKPPTEDYVPLLPWLGVMLAGCAAGGAWTRRGRRSAPGIPAPWGALPSWLRVGLAATGRNSLTIYLVHQPLLLGALGLVHRAG